MSSFSNRHRRPGRRTTMAQMNQARAQRKLYLPEVRVPTAAEREALAAAKDRLAAKERADRAREEERKRLLDGLARVTPEDWSKYLKEERIVKQAQAHVEKVREEPEMDIAAVFGIEVE